MTATQITERKTLSRRILALPDETVVQVTRYPDDVERHEPNEETVAAILEGDELAKIYCSRFIENDIESEDS